MKVLLPLALLSGLIIGIVFGIATVMPTSNISAPLVNRGQQAVLFVQYKGYDTSLTFGTQTFADVPIGSQYYNAVENMAAHELIGFNNGQPEYEDNYLLNTVHPCGGPREPCDAENRPYFRPYN